MTKEFILEDLKKHLISIDSIQPNPTNTRLHDNPNIESIKNSLVAYGQRVLVIVNKNTSYIEKGNGVWLSAKELGWENIAVIFVDDDEEMAKGFEIMDNRTSDLSKMDLKQLKDAIETFDTGEFDLEKMLGYKEEDIEVLMRQFHVEDEKKNARENDIPEVDESKIICKTGDLWQLENHKILIGDCTDRENINRLLSGKKIDIVFTDPPYGVHYANKNTFLNSIDKGNRNQRKIENDHQSEKEIQVFWKKIFEIIRDNLNPEYNSYYVTGPQIQGMMMMMMQEAGLPYRHVIIWVKNNHVLGRCDYNYKHEPLFFGWTTRHKFYGNGTMKTSVWEIDKPRKNDLHPTMKPIALIENALLNSSKHNDICFDPFLGSGSTLIACEKTNRVCYGCEIDPHYGDVVINRYLKYTDSDGNNVVRQDGKRWSDLIK